MTKDKGGVEELEILFPEGRIKPFQFKDFKRVVSLLHRYQGLFSGAGDFVQTLVDDGAIDELAELAMLSVEGLTREELDALPFHQAIDLFFRVAEVNADFFTTTLQRGAERLAMALNGAGEKSTAS
jgi:hypothetical protein